MNQEPNSRRTATADAREGISRLQPGEDVNAPRPAAPRPSAGAFLMSGGLMADQQPSVGRIVHYVSYGTPGGEYGKECRAAIVTWVHPDTIDAEDQLVSLCVFNPTGQFFAETVAHHEAPETDTQAPGGGALNHPGGTWHWPERV